MYLAALFILSACANKEVATTSPNTLVILSDKNDDITTLPPNVKKNDKLAVGYDNSTVASCSKFKSASSDATVKADKTNDINDTKNYWARQDGGAIRNSHEKMMDSVNNKYDRSKWYNYKKK